MREQILKEGKRVDGRKLDEVRKIDAIAGVATAGIPQGALVAEKMNLPFVYVRSKPKSHGMKNMVEGKLDSISNITLFKNFD